MQVTSVPGGTMDEMLVGPWTEKSHEDAVELRSPPRDSPPPVGEDATHLYDEHLCGERRLSRCDLGRSCDQAGDAGGQTR